MTSSVVLWGIGFDAGVGCAISALLAVTEGTTVRLTGYPVPYNTADGTLFRVGDGQRYAAHQALVRCLSARGRCWRRGILRDPRAPLGRPAATPWPGAIPRMWRSYWGRLSISNSRSGVNDAYCGSARTPPRAALRQRAETLPADRAGRHKREVGDVHCRYAVPAGLHVKREYLLTFGHRR